VKTNAGRVALARGAIVYCVEGVDNGGRVADLVLPRDAAIGPEEWAAEGENRGAGSAADPESPSATETPLSGGTGGRAGGRDARSTDLLKGMTVLRAQGLRVRGEDEWGGELYRAAEGAERVVVTAVPYFAWDNRGDSGMMVWLPESGALLGPAPVKWIRKATVSHCWAGDRPESMCDRREPGKSGDESIPRMTWWDHKGTTEWAQYEFDKARKVSGVEVYWFDDTGRGHCRVPAAWRVLYRDGTDWKRVVLKGGGDGKDGLGVEKDTFNAVSFETVETDGLRLEVELRPRYSGGILEWRVVEGK
jgi:hypothetical protein